MTKRPSTLRFDELEAAIQRGDGAACIAFFEPLDEKERGKYATRALAHLRTMTKSLPSRIFDGSFGIDSLETLRGGLLRAFGINVDSKQIRAAQLATLASASLAHLKKLGTRALPAPEQTCRIMSARRPPWLDEWAELVCTISEWSWPIVRSLVRAGLCQHPKSDAYIEGMIRCVPGLRNPGKKIRDALLDDPGLLEHEIWRLFEIEPRKGALQNFGLDSWSDALAELAREGKIPRERLIDATLDALHRDFHELRARWFAQVHDALAPTIEEGAARTDHYVSLLQSSNSSTVTFAVDVLETLAKEGRLDGELLIGSIGPGLRSRYKGVARKALRMLAKAAGRNSRQAQSVALAAATALLHEMPEVQDDAVEIIRKFGNPEPGELRSLVVERLAGMAASPRKKVEAWLQTSAPAATESVPALAQGFMGLVEQAKDLDPVLAERAGIAELVEICQGLAGPISAAPFDGTDAPRLDPDKRVLPIQDLDDLVEACARVFENPGAIDDFERILDGVSRLCDRRPVDFQKRLEPLVARARELASGMFPYSHIVNALANLAFKWAGWSFPLLAHGGEGLFQFFNERLTAIANRVGQGIAAPLLSAPTHEGGWIDPMVLVARARECCQLDFAPDIPDQILCILRLAPDNRKQALEEAVKLEGPFAHALRHALGAEGEPIGVKKSLWIAAARVRAPFQDDSRVEERHPNCGPDAGCAAQYRFATRFWETPRSNYYRAGSNVIERIPDSPSDCPKDLPTVALHDLKSYWAGADWIRWLASVWPSARESLFAAGVEQIAGFEDAQMDAGRKRPCLDALFDPDVPCRPMAVLLVMSALSAKHPDLHVYATDALIAAIEDGRLDGVKLGKAMALLLPTGLIKPSRWAKNLTLVARVSPFHAEVIAEAIQLGLVGDSESPPGKLTWSSLQGLLELLKELLVETGSGLSPMMPAKGYLSGLKASGRTARLVAELLVLEYRDPNTHHSSAAAYALARRIERVDRWKQWQAGKD